MTRPAAWRWGIRPDHYAFISSNDHEKSSHDPSYDPLHEQNGTRSRASSRNAFSFPNLQLQINTALPFEFLCAEISYPSPTVLNILCNIHPTTAESAVQLHRQKPIGQRLDSQNLVLFPAVLCTPIIFPPFKQSTS